jgi:aryl-alcohol dehydrogenase-like predicted oxidoreductase
VTALERRGVSLSPLALGGAGLGGSIYGEVSEHDAVRVVEVALENGVTHLDTSPKYGDSERRIGLALRGVPRNSYTLYTKVGTSPEHAGYSADAVRRSLKVSLERLGVSQLDLVLIHDPVELTESLQPGGALRALEELRDAGVIRAIGLGVRDHGLLLQAIRSGRFDAVLTFLDYTLLRSSASLHVLPEAAHHGVTVLNGSPLAMGLLGGGDPAEHFRRVLTWVTDDWTHDLTWAALLRDFAQRHRVALPALALQFCLRESMISSTVLGAKNPSELEELLAYSRQPIADSVWRDLETLGLLPDSSIGGSHAHR